jgi:hypothetical protein
MFDRTRGTISLTHLANEMKAARLIREEAIRELDALLAEAAPIASKVTVLRHYAFAHRSATVSYNAAFKKAAVTPTQLRELTEIALKIANRLLLARGLKDEVFTPLPLGAAKEMMKALASASK